MKFFFGHDAQRTDLLFDLLMIPQAEQDDVRRLARECMEKEGDVTCRLVIDGTTWGIAREHSEPLFEALEQMVLQPAEKLKLTPIVLVIVEQQYKWVPRSYDDLLDADALAVEKVKDDKEGWSKVEKLAGDGALVASSRRYQPTERWLAMEESAKKSLALEPAQGLDIFARSARLPAPPSAVAHPLHQVASAVPNAKAPIPNRPGELRRLTLALADESQVASLKLTATDRLALAHALGVPATSTEPERLEHELAVLAGKIGKEPKKLSKDELDQLLARAQRRDVEFSLLRVGDELHVLNPPPNLSVAEGPRLKLHRHSSRRPAINRLMEVIDQWTADDYAADRGLVRVIDRLDPHGEERIAFLHARACLLWSNGLRSPLAPARLPDWKAGLTKLLAGDPPAAQLRLSVDQEVWPAGHLAPFVALKEEPDVVPSGASSPIKLNSDDAAVKLLGLAPLASSPCMCRGQTAYLFDFYRREKQYDSYSREMNLNYSLVAKHFSQQDLPYHYSFDRGRQHASDMVSQLPKLPSVLIPHSSHAFRQQDMWLDLLDCSTALSGSNFDPESWDRVLKAIRAESLFPIRSVSVSRFTVEVPGSIWAEADQELALCWLALKNALAQGNAVRLHDGIVLLSIGAGLVARLDIRCCKTVDESSSAEQQVRGCLDAWVKYGTRKVDREEQVFWEAHIDHRPVTTHRATTTGYEKITATTTLGYELPQLYLAGYGIRVEIAFLTSPLFLSYSGMVPPVVGLAAAGTQALAAEQREDQRRADEAAYDD